ncbi:hypothetical protein HPP92_003669 [Vanilla planifolia]|uniref:Uncharacterized protein n=1 Tax=Vanilla planifolia TaxID=51239 RepID=A0A835S7Y3_VANPL|nr:hypothetical protein HPP92_003669 [Vanilla planifolia]
MEEVLMNPHCGFYINRDVFGAGGDFITSVEMIVVWTMCLWEQRWPSSVNSVELDPERGMLIG